MVAALATLTACAPPDAGGEADASAAGPAGSGAPDASTWVAPLPEPDADPAWFTDEAAAAGLDFVHFNGAAGRFHYPELIPPGVALLDVDNDGDLDVYLVQGRMLDPDLTPDDALAPPPPGARPLTGRLYRNDLPADPSGRPAAAPPAASSTTRAAAAPSAPAAGAAPLADQASAAAVPPAPPAAAPPSAPAAGAGAQAAQAGTAPAGAGALRFTDVTAASGIEAAGYGLGVAAGDVNNDGWTDLFLTSFGGDALYLNDGDGTFTDATAASGLGAASAAAARGAAPAAGFGVSASFVDIDRDGWLDLYVGRNVDYAIGTGIVCGTLADARDYCPPETYGGTPDHLYRNTGGGRFVDVSETALAGARFGPALGVATADFDGDGWIDIYVANDGVENLLWINRGDGTFREDALLAGAALSALGAPEASMGVDAGDADNDGDDDLFMTHLTGQGHNLYLNDGAGRFRDRSTPSGLGADSRPDTGWGAAWIDFDNDGWLDLLTVNGTITALSGGPDRPFPYDQRKALFRNLGGGRFEDVTARAGAVFARPRAGRGAAFGDVDNDGDTDVLVGNDAGPVQLLINHVGARRHWLGLRLVGRGGRDMLGARVTVRRPGAPPLVRRARADGSYASANDPRVLVGLGASAARPAVDVQWPDGSMETWPDVGIDRWLTLRQGAGAAPPEGR